MAEPRLSQRAIRQIAENRIREAMEEGAFDNLPGAGKPIPGIDQPYDPQWWIRRWMERERLRELPRELRELRG